MQEFLNRKTRIIGSKLVHIFLILFLSFLVFSVIRSFSQIQNAIKLIDEEEKKLEDIRKKQKDLQEQLEKVQSKSFIEKQLRDNLGLAKEGEIVIILPDDSVVKRFAPKDDLEEVNLPDPNWRKWLKLFF